jgi:hypothetical protein
MGNKNSGHPVSKRFLSEITLLFLNSCSVLHPHSKIAAIEGVQRTETFRTLATKKREEGLIL